MLVMFLIRCFFGCQRALDHFCCSENTNSQESIAGSFIPLLQKIWLVGSNNVALLPNSRIWNSWLLLDGILGAWSDVLFLCAPKIVPLQRYIKKNDLGPPSPIWGWLTKVKCSSLLKTENPRGSGKRKLVRMWPVEQLIGMEIGQIGIV